MMERLLARGRRIGEARVARALARAEGAAGEDLPGGITVENTGDGLVISGRGLGSRWLVDGRLRGIGALVKGMAR